MSCCVRELCGGRWGMRRPSRRGVLGGHGERRRESGRRRDFWVEPERCCEGLGYGDEGDVAVPAGVGASFEVVQAEAVFEFAVVVFDAPADLGALYEGR